MPDGVLGWGFWGRDEVKLEVEHFGIHFGMAVYFGLDWFSSPQPTRLRFCKMKHQIVQSNLALQAETLEPGADVSW